jgi:hypothetical protein
MVMKTTDLCSLNDNYEMTPSIAVMIAEGIEAPRSEDEFIQAWQYIYNSGLYLQLQGWYGRRIEDMIREGILDA